MRSQVNTMIGQNTQFLGLAQLHQLRGRVGRSNVQAHASALEGACQQDVWRGAFFSSVQCTGKR